METQKAPQADYSGMTDDELKSRSSVVLERLDKNLKEVAPFLTRIGHLRNEAASLVDEMRKRKLIPDGELAKDVVKK